jgi:hypothetical protein
MAGVGLSHGEGPSHASDDGRRAVQLHRHLIGMDVPVRIFLRLHPMMSTRSPVGRSRRSSPCDSDDVSLVFDHGDCALRPVECRKEGIARARPPAVVRQVVPDVEERERPVGRMKTARRVAQPLLHSPNAFVACPWQYSSHSLDGIALRIVEVVEQFSDPLRIGKICPAAT